MRSKKQNKFDVPAASGGGGEYLLLNDQPFMIWMVDPVGTHSYYQDRELISVRDKTLSVHYYTVSEKSIFYKARLVFVVNYLINKRKIDGKALYVQHSVIV